MCCGLLGSSTLKLALARLSGVSCSAVSRSCGGVLACPSAVGQSEYLAHVRVMEAGAGGSLCVKMLNRERDARAGGRSISERTGVSILPPVGTQL